MQLPPVIIHFRSGFSLTKTNHFGVPPWLWKPPYVLPWLPLPGAWIWPFSTPLGRRAAVTPRRIFEKNGGENHRETMAKSEPWNMGVSLEWGIPSPFSMGLSKCAKSWLLESDSTTFDLGLLGPINSNDLPRSDVGRLCVRSWYSPITL